MLALFRSQATLDLQPLDVAQILSHLSVDPLQVEPLVDTLVSMDWVARLDEDGGQRLVLLADPATTSVRPLVDALLIGPSPLARVTRERLGVDRLHLADLF